MFRVQSWPDEVEDPPRLEGHRLIEAKSINRRRGGSKNRLNVLDRHGWQDEPTSEKTIHYHGGRHDGNRRKGACRQPDAIALKHSQLAAAP